MAKTRKLKIIQNKEIKKVLCVTRIRKEHQPEPYHFKNEEEEKNINFFKRLYSIPILLVQSLRWLIRFSNS